MRKKKKCILLIFLTFFADIGINAQSPLNDKNWLLNTIKSDEFSSTTLDPKWNLISGDHWGESVFDPNYVSVDNINLNLKIDKIGSTYYTGGIETNASDYQYGYFEIEAILPYGKGLWPCFWIWGAGGLNSYTEFDILEPAGCQYQFGNTNVYGFWYKPSANAPCSAWSGSPDYLNGCDVKVEFEKTNISNMALNKHKYAVEWHPNQVIFYLDDVPIGSACNDSRVPFNPTRVVIDLQTSGDACAPNSQTTTPQNMKVNYFRYYTMKMDCNTPISVNSNNFDFTNNANLAVKKSYTITNSIIPSSLTTTIRAKDFIELGVGFEVPSNTVFNAVITPCY